MSEVLRREEGFKNFSCVRYATYVTFQLAFRPSGSVSEGKVYYSGKHKNYGYKVEVSVLQNGFAINCTDHVPGSKAGIEIMREKFDAHQIMTKKIRVRA